MSVLIFCLFLHSPQSHETSDQKLITTLVSPPIAGVGLDSYYFSDQVLLGLNEGPWEEEETERGISASPYDPEACLFGCRCCWWQHDWMHQWSLTLADRSTRNPLGWVLCSHKVGSTLRFLKLVGGSQIQCLQIPPKQTPLAVMVYNLSQAPQGPHTCDKVSEGPNGADTSPKHITNKQTPRLNVCLFSWIWQLSMHIYVRNVYLALMMFFRQISVRNVLCVMQLQGGTGLMRGHTGYSLSEMTGSKILVYSLGFLCEYLQDAFKWWTVDCAWRKAERNLPVAISQSCIYSNFMSGLDIIYQHSGLLILVQVRSKMRSRQSMV